MCVNVEIVWVNLMAITSQTIYGPSRIGGGDGVIAPDGTYTIRSDNLPNTITLRSGAEEMLKCNTEGFWVRGVKVAQDDKEAEIVYNAFKEWLTWASLSDLR